MRDVLPPPSQTKPFYSPPATRRSGPSGTVIGSAEELSAPPAAHAAPQAALSGGPSLPSAEDCGACINCLDKPKFGGPGIKRKGCLTKRGAGSRASPPLVGTASDAMALDSDEAVIFVDAPPSAEPRTVQPPVCDNESRPDNHGSNPGARGPELAASSAALAALDGAGHGSEGILHSSADAAALVAIPQDQMDVMGSPVTKRPVFGASDSSGAEPRSLRAGTSSAASGASPMLVDEWTKSSIDDDTSSSHDALCISRSPAPAVKAENRSSPRELPGSRRSHPSTPVVMKTPEIEALVQAAIMHSPLSDFANILEMTPRIPEVARHTAHPPFAYSPPACLQLSQSISNGWKALPH